MPKSNYPNGFSDGLTVRGIPLTMSNPGKVFWVNNSSVLGDGAIAGSNLIGGGTYQQPFNSILYALAQCVASRGDVIVCMPGHTEAISSASSLAISVAGVSILSLGSGSSRATFTYGTAATATIAVSAANVSFINCLFKANFLDVASAFTLTTAADFAAINCEFRDNSSILNFLAIVDTNTTSNDADGILLDGCKRIGAGATNATCIVKMDGTNSRLTIQDCYLAHNAVTAAGLMPIATGKVVTHAIIKGNTINLVGAAGVTTGILITTDGSTNSGMISHNLINSLDATTEILVTATSGFKYSQNYYSGVADSSGYLLPAADS